MSYQSHQVKPLEKSRLRVLVAAYRCFPNFSATATTLNNLLLNLEPEEFILASLDYSLAGQSSADVGAQFPKPTYVGSAKRDTLVPRKLNSVFSVASIPTLARRLERLGRKTGCRQVLGIYPNITFLGGAALAAERLGVPFYVWLHNTPKAIQWSGFYNEMLGLESRILGKARCIFAMSDAMRDEYRELYPKIQVETLQHPFFINNERPPEPDYNERPLRLLFAGAVGQSNADALGNIIQATRNEPTKYEIHISSRTEKAVLSKLFGDLGNLHCHGFVDNATLEELHRKAHILLLPHGLHGRMADIEYRTIFPTKTITYMMANRPIFAHIPAGCGIDRYLSNKKAAFIQYSSAAENIKAGLDILAGDTDLRQNLARHCVQALGQFHAPAVAKIFREQINCST